MKPAQQFDIVGIGGGPAGICGANTAGIFGKRVALVEKLPEVGGAGINTGTIPEASMAGETEDSLGKKDIAYVVGRTRYMDDARGRIVGDESGLLLGVHVVGEQATELVHIGLVAMMSGSGAELFRRTCFNYPTLGDLYKYATYEAILKRDGLVADERERSARQEVLICP